MTGLPPTRLDPSSATQRPVELIHATKRYGATVALSDVTIAAQAGEVLAVLGPNGAGKTTAINLMLGLAKPTAGEARLFGANPNSAASKLSGGRWPSWRFPSCSTFSLASCSALRTCKGSARRATWWSVSPPLAWWTLRSSGSAWGSPRSAVGSTSNHLLVIGLSTAVFLALAV